MKNDQFFTNYAINHEFEFMHCFADPPENVDSHYHNFHELYLSISGDLTYYIEDNAYPIHKSDIIIISSNESHRCDFHSSLPNERIVIYFSNKYLAGFHPDIFNLLNFLTRRKPGTQNKIDSRKVDTSKIFKLAQLIDNNIHTHSKESLIRIKLYFIELLISLYTIYQNNNELITIPRHKDQTVNQLLSFINKNFEQKITLDMLEEQFFISKFHLCHIFKDYTGFTIKEYIVNKRIMRAKQLLLEGYPLIDTCFEVGFSDYSNFSKTFKKLTCKTPKQFVKSS